MAKWGEVIDITEFRKPGPTGEIETWYRYRATSKGGVTFTANIPEAETTPEKVDQVLEAKATRLDRTKVL